MHRVKENEIIWRYRLILGKRLGVKWGRLMERGPNRWWRKNTEHVMTKDVSCRECPMYIPILFACTSSMRAPTSSIKRIYKWKNKNSKKATACDDPHWDICVIRCKLFMMSGDVTMQADEWWQIMKSISSQVLVYLGIAEKINAVSGFTEYKA